jgi:mannose-6-phosphate isomerase-like protein (cupin superfamily)
VSDTLKDASRDPRDAVLLDKRPWGQFERFTLNEPTTVKIITVESGHRLSLQRHAHRDELWTILDGPLDVEIDGRAWAAQPDEKIWLPRGTPHRVGNSGDRPGRFLEIAFGEFDEGDIERLSDDYNR